MSLLSTIFCPNCPADHHRKQNRTICGRQASPPVLKLARPAHLRSLAHPGTPAPRQIIPLPSRHPDAKNVWYETLSFRPSFGCRLWPIPFPLPILHWARSNRRGRPLEMRFTNRRYLVDHARPRPILAQSSAAQIHRRRFHEQRRARLGTLTSVLAVLFVLFPPPFPGRAAKDVLRPRHNRFRPARRRPGIFLLTHNSLSL